MADRRIFDDPLKSLRRATVRLRDPRDPARWGTGFFVANDVLLTCWHVWRDGSDQWVLVEQPPLPQDLDLEAEPQRNPSHGLRTLTLGKATLLEQGETWDLALLRFTPSDQGTGADGKRFEPVVLPLVVEDPSPGAQLLTTAFPHDAEGWHDGTYQAAGRTTPSGQQREFLRFKADGVVPGFSGSPLLIHASGLVCGVIARNDLPGGASDGGLAVPMTVFCRAFPINAAALLERNAAEHHPGLSTIRRPLGRSDWSWPLPLDFSPYRTFRRAGFVGRDWLFEEIRDWLGVADNGAGRPRALLIEAEYGVGKSAFLAELVDTQAAGIPVVAQHFCQFDAIATLAPGRFVSSIAAQLAAALPAYRAAIEAEAAAGLRQLLEAPDNDPIGAFDQAVLAPLEAMAPPAGPLLLVVDALDEALEHRPSNDKAARVTIVSLLGQRAQRFPRWLRLLATARPLPAVQQPLRQAFSLHSLNAEEARNLADIEAYAAARCQRPPLAARLAAAGLGASEVAIRLRALSGGKFLYVAFVLNDLESGALPLRDRHDLEALPSGMDAFYLQAFERRFPTEAAYAEVRDLLAVHCVQRDPLSRRELEAILSWPEARLLNQQKDLHDLLRLSRNDPAYGPKEFLASFNHPSLGRWLTATDEHFGYPLAGRFCIDPEAAEAAIHSWALAEVETNQAHRSPYLVRHLTSHLTVEERPVVIAGQLGQLAWLEARLRLAGLIALLGDFTMAAPAPWLGRLGRALGQGAHVLVRREGWDGPKQLAPQLLARLADYGSQIRNLRADAAAKIKEFGGVLPLEASLVAHEALRLTLPVSSGVNALVVLPDGHLASGHSDFRIRIWELDSGTCTAVLERQLPRLHMETCWGVTALALLPDGQLASGSADPYEVLGNYWNRLEVINMVHIWELALDTFSTIFAGHKNGVKGLLVLPCGRLACFSGYWDNTIRIIDPGTGDCIEVFNGHKDEVMALVALQDGRLASSSLDKTIRFWDLANAECCTILEVHYTVLSLVVLPDGRLAAGCDDGIIRFFNPTNGLRLADFKINLHATVLLVLSDGRLAAGGFSSVVHILDHVNGICTYLEGHQAHINALAELPCGRLVSGTGGDLGTDYCIRIWDPASSSDSLMLDGYQKEKIVLTVLRDGRFVCGKKNGTVSLIDPSTRSHVNIIGDNSGQISALTVLADGRLVSASEGRMYTIIRIWSPASGDCVKAFSLFSSSVRSLVTLANGSIAAALGDGTIQLFAPETGTRLASLKAERGVITAMAVLPCDLLASASDDSDGSMFDLATSSIRIWDLKTSTCRYILDSQEENTVRSLVTLHDGRLASGSDDNIIRIWNPKTGKRTNVLYGHQNPVTALTVLTDGRLVSGSGRFGDDNSIRLWNPERLDRANEVLFIADTAITALAAHSTLPLLVAGDASGRLHWLELPKAC